MATTVYTIGHSTHPIDEFLEMLSTFQIEQLVDVRSIPGSRHNPQYNETELQSYLQKHDIDYVHMKELGGLRHTTKTSINTAWKNASFRGFADYMQTEAFQKGIERLIELAQSKSTAIMCAEAVPWRCHRSLIGDALLARNVGVVDILSKNTSKPHKLTPWAKLDGNLVTYPGTEPDPLDH